MKKTQRILSVAIILSLFLTGCGKENRKDSEKTLAGWVYGSEPIASAKLSFFDEKGEQILKKESIVSDEQGVILFDTKKLPADFKIVTDGGKLYGEAFNAALRTDVSGFQQDSDKIYLNFATTLVGAYLDKNSSATLEDATKSVKKFLELPEWFDLASGTQISGQYFNNSQFLSEANDNGGVNEFNKLLLNEMEQGKTHPFQQEVLQSITTELGLALAKGAASYLGGELAGWALSTTGLDFTEEGRTEKELEAINEGMQEMKTTMNAMSIQINALNIQMKQMQEQLKEQLKTIEHQQLLSEYAERVSQLNSLLSAIDTIQRDLTLFAINPQKDASEMRQRIINRIEDKIVDDADTIHNYLVALAGGKALIPLWRETVYEDRFLDSYDYERLVAQIAFFEEYQKAELLLRIEYYHATESTMGANEQIILDCIEKFEEQLAAQKALLPSPIEKNCVVDTKWDVLFHSDNIEFGKEGSSYPSDDQTPAEVFDYMEQYASNAYAGYSDWSALDYDLFGALTYNFKPDRDGWNFSEFLIKNGWPGTKVTVAVIPFKNYTDGAKFMSQALFLNDSSHPKNFFPYTDTSSRLDGYFMLMAGRFIAKITPDNPYEAALQYGYKHLK